MNSLRERLTFANVVSVIALFVALGGGAYAIGIGKNDVGAREIARNAVRSSELKNDAAKGTDVDESSLGQVPSAANADTLDGIDSAGFQRSGPPEAWQPLDFAAGWANHPAASFVDAVYRKDQLGKVHLRGVVTNVTGAPGVGELIATLPAGYRPPGASYFAVGTGPSAEAGVVSVGADGAVKWQIGQSGPETDFTDLSGVSFWTD